MSSERELDADVAHEEGAGHATRATSLVDLRRQSAGPTETETDAEALGDLELPLEAEAGVPTEVGAVPARILGGRPEGAADEREAAGEGTVPVADARGSVQAGTAANVGGRGVPEGDATHEPPAVLVERPGEGSHDGQRRAEGDVGRSAAGEEGEVSADAPVALVHLRREVRDAPAGGRLTFSQGRLSATQGGEGRIDFGAAPALQLIDIAAELRQLTIEPLVDLANREARHAELVAEPPRTVLDGLAGAQLDELPPDALRDRAGDVLRAGGGRRAAVVVVHHDRDRLGRARASPGRLLDRTPAVDFASHGGAGVRPKHVQLVEAGGVDVGVVTVVAASPPEVVPGDVQLAAVAALLQVEALVLGEDAERHRSVRRPHVGHDVAHRVVAGRGPGDRRDARDRLGRGGAEVGEADHGHRGQSEHEGIEALVHEKPLLQGCVNWPSHATLSIGIFDYSQCPRAALRLFPVNSHTPTR